MNITIEQSRLGLDFRTPQSLLGDAMRGLTMAHGTDRSRYLATDLTPDRIRHSFAQFQYGLGLAIDPAQSGGVRFKLHAEELGRELSPEERIAKLTEELGQGEQAGLEMVRFGILTFQALKQIHESEVSSRIPGSWEAISGIIETDFPHFQFTPQV